MTDHEVEVMARQVFLTNLPKNMVPADWDSGATLGFNNGLRLKCIETARAALTALRSIDGHEAMREALAAIEATLPNRPTYMRLKEIARAALSAGKSQETV